MATLATEGRNAACDGVVDLLDAGNVVFQTAAHSDVAECTFGTPAFGASGAVNPGEAVAETITDDSTAAGGTVDHCHIRKSDDTPILDCTAGTGAEEFVLTSVVIGVGDTVSITALTITQPAS